MKREHNDLGTIEITCTQCETKLDRPVSQYRTSQKRGVTVFSCSKECSGRNRIKHAIKDRALWRITGKKLDKLSPVMTALKKTRSRKNWENNLTAEYLKRVRDSQIGMCALSGIKLDPLRFYNE